MNIFMSAQESFEELSEEEKINHMGVESEQALTKLLIIFMNILTNLS